MKSLIIILIIMLIGFFAVACGEDTEPTTIYVNKNIYVECFREMEERCEEYSCTEKQRIKYIEDFCVVEE